MTMRPETAEEKEARERQDIELYSISQTVLQAYNLAIQFPKEKVDALIRKRNEIMVRIGEHFLGSGVGTP